MAPQPIFEVYFKNATITKFDTVNSCGITLAKSVTVSYISLNSG